MRQSRCDQCGQSFDVPSISGPLPALCPPHAELDRRAKAKARDARRRAGQHPREVSCADCGKSIAWNGKGRPRLRCDPCRDAHNRLMASQRSFAWAQANPERARELQRKGYQRNAAKIRARKLDEHYVRKYGITRAERDQMIAAQGGCCAICNKAPVTDPRRSKLHVDHCHSTGKVRGLLCGNCNTLIGLAGEDPAVLRSAITYLARE